MENRVAVLVSKGSLLLDSLVDEGIPISVVIANKECEALIKSRDLGIKSQIICDESELMGALKEEEVDLVVLSEYSRPLSNIFLNEFKDVINIHASLLPSFKGSNPIEDALKKGVKVTGVTVYKVDDDNLIGEILAQEPVVIKDYDNLKSIKEKIFEKEKKLYPKTISKLLKDKLM